MASKTCFYCGGELTNDDEIVEFRVPYASGKSYHRNFHERCLPEFKHYLAEQGGELKSAAYNKELNSKKTAQKKETCTYCGRMFTNEQHTLVLRNQYGSSYGKYHQECYMKYLRNMQDADGRKKEMKEWEEAYDYFAYEILGLRPSQARQNKDIMYRLGGLRIGKRSINRGDVIMGVEAGYPYKTILYTMKYVKDQIVEEFSRRRFHDIRHKINYTMVIIWKNIDFIDGRVRAMERQARLTEIETKKRLEEQERLKDIKPQTYKPKGTGKKVWWYDEDDFDDEDEF